MQLGDRRTQPGRGLLQRRVDHVQRGIGVALAGLVEFEAGGEQRLQRAVVQVLGHFAVVPFVGLHRLGHQLPAHLLQRLDTRRSSGAGRSTARSSRRPATAGSRSACTRCWASRLVVALGVDDPDREIAHRGDDSEDRRQQRAGPERHRDRQQEEHRQQRRRRTARHQAQRDDHQQVDDRGRPVGPPRHRSAEHGDQPQHRRDGVGARGSPRTARAASGRPPRSTPARAIRPISGSRRTAETRTGSRELVDERVRPATTVVVLLASAANPAVCGAWPLPPRRRGR